MAHVRIVHLCLSTAQALHRPAHYITPASTVDAEVIDHGRIKAFLSAEAGRRCDPNRRQRKAHDGGAGLKVFA
jgi:hypothetical protein